MDKIEITKMIKSINQFCMSGDFEKLNDLYHDNVVFQNPDFKNKLIGKKDCINSYVEFFQSIDDLELAEYDYSIDIIENNAVVSYSYEFHYFIGDKEFDFSGKDLLMLTKKYEKWKIIWRTIVENNDKKNLFKN